MAPAKAIVLLPASMVLEDLAVQNARRPETFADRSVRDIPDPEMPVIVGSIKVAAMDDYAVAAVLINVPMALRALPSVGGNGSPSPVAMGVIRLMGCQGNPSHIGPGVNPRYPSRIPCKSDMEQRQPGPDHDMGHRRRPIPISGRENPVAVMMGHIAERFVGNPDVVAMPYDPGAPAKRRPAGADMDRAPKPVVVAFVIDPLPMAVRVQRISLAAQFRGQIGGRLPTGVHALGPKVVHSLVPIRPFRNAFAVNCRDLLHISEKG